jgi:hypothetical protein
MEAATVLDIVILAPALILGLIGVWLGLGRSLVAWPMRWLIPLLGACLVALPALVTVAAGEASAVLDLSGVAAAAAAVSFLLTGVLLVMFMRNLRERMGVWSGGRRTSLAGRIAGALFGIVLGLLLVAIPCVLYDSLWPSRGAGPAWGDQSLTLPYIRGASQALRTALTEYVFSAPERLRR